MEIWVMKKEGMRALVAVSLLVVAARAFLVPTTLVQEHATLTSSRCRPTTRRTATYALAQQQPQQQPQQGSSGVGGLSATIHNDAITRAEALSGFITTLVLSTAVVADSQSSDGLGVVDDLLADCPSSPTCVSSQDDRPYSFMEPWAYEGPYERSMARLRSYLELAGAKVVASSARYLRVEFDATKAFPPSVDDAEFYFTPGDALVQFRCARRDGPTDFGANRRRMDSIRVALKFESIPVLRNRKRVLFFGESPIDLFGPSFGKVDPSVIYGDVDPMSPPFETPSDALRERYGGADGIGDKPAWWGKPLAKAGGFGD